MRKADVLRLPIGSRIYFGNHHFGAKTTWTATGTVRVITPKGGVLVELDSGRERWVAYNHIWHVIEKAPKATR